MSSGKIARILLAIAEPSARMSNAVRRAGALAHATHASIELLNAIPSAMSLGPAHAQSEQFVRFEAEQNRRSLARTDGEPSTARRNNRRDDRADRLPGP
jgi:hypothetical protein